jgi:hypothetical protein
MLVTFHPVNGSALPPAALPSAAATLFAFSPVFAVGRSARQALAGGARPVYDDASL